MSTVYSKKEIDYLAKVGSRIRDRRLFLKLSQESFAKLCELDRTYISDVERGTRNVSLLTLLKIAKSLQVSPQELLPIKKV